MKIFSQLFLLFVLTLTAYAESDSYPTMEYESKTEMSESDFMAKLDYFRNVALNIEKIVKEADKDLAKAETDISDFYSEDKNIITRFFSWIMKNKENNPLESLSSEEQATCRILISEVHEKAQNAKNIMLDLRDKVKNLVEELEDAEKLKRDLKNKYKHAIQEESNAMSNELKKRNGHLKRLFDRTEEEAKELKSKVNSLMEGIGKIKRRLNSNS